MMQMREAAAGVNAMFRIFVTTSLAVSFAFLFIALAEAAVRLP
jgi:hypothetical protein